MRTLGIAGYIGLVWALAQRAARGLYYKVEIYFRVYMACYHILTVGSVLCLIKL